MQENLSLITHHHSPKEDHHGSSYGSPTKTLKRAHLLRHFQQQGLPGTVEKAWLAERLDQGLVFLKGDVRGKCFIEYIPCRARLGAHRGGRLPVHRLPLGVRPVQRARLLQPAFGRVYPGCQGPGQRGLAVLSSEKKPGYLGPQILKIQGFSDRGLSQPPLPADGAPL